MVCAVAVLASSPALGGRVDLHRYVALLHSIILTEGRRVVMSDLRRLAEEAGLQNPRTHAATGNLVIESSQLLGVSEVELRLESGISRDFGKHIDVIARTEQAWKRLAQGNPFPDESRQDGSLVIVRVMRQPIDTDTANKLCGYQKSEEQLKIVAGDLWVSFAESPSKSRLLPQLTARKLGPGTLRNWNTVRGISGMLKP
jgi:uncharacterized protein (DUF1697 family)